MVLAAELVLILMLVHTRCGLVRVADEPEAMVVMCGLLRLGLESSDGARAEC